MSETPTYAGCPWPIDTTCIPADWNNIPAETQTYAVALASSSLHTLTARRVGGCPITIRPCLQTTCYAPYRNIRGWYPGITVDGSWVNSCGCSAPCSHPADRSVALPPPVGRVDSIKVDGVALDLADFRLDDGHVIVYDGNGDFTFPSEQDLRLSDSEPGTWSITYLNGARPDLLAARAAALMAWEFAKACVDDRSLGECRLPSNVRAITRTGVTMELNAGLWPDGFVGIEEIDAWIATVNPHQRKSQTRIYSPDLPAPHIQGPRLA